MLKEELLISAGQAESLLRDGEECCLLLAAMRVETERVITEIDVVRDFVEVFLDEVSGLPSVREMEFNIDLVPGAGPVSVAPYRMAPAEFVELKGQVLSWEEVLPLVEFTYNNSFHASIGLGPFEALYGERCRTPLCRYQDGESVVVGPELIPQTIEEVKLIQERMKTAQSRQKSYVDKRHKPLELNLHDVFHVSQLRKYVHDPGHVVELDGVRVKEKLAFEKLSVAVVDHKLEELMGKSIALVKVLWDVEKVSN
uniref:Retrotransposable element Tf2 n=1 Tax=Cajanus cajan TaxID=3821 RepID=A0A151TUK0_CAJCA|nr:hypothetical protein KK1_009959 [Cajanus cajan]